MPPFAFRPSPHWPTQSTGLLGHVRRSGRVCFLASASCQLSHAGSVTSRSSEIASPRKGANSEVQRSSVEALFRSSKERGTSTGAPQPGRLNGSTAARPPTWPSLHSCTMPCSALPTLKRQRHVAARESVPAIADHSLPRLARLARLCQVGRQHHLALLGG